MDNPITVELPADLPTNWQQYQVVSPNGTEAGLDEKHGYNYLMEQVNNAQTAASECGEALESAVPASRKINNKNLSSDVVLTGADINVSGSDTTPISTALSNKADGTTHKLQTYTAYTDIGLSGTDITPAQILDALPLNSMLVVNNTETTSLSDEYIPSVSYYGVLIAMKISSNALQLKWFTPLNGNGTRADDYTGVYRSASTPPWSGWAPEATAEPPQEYNLTTTNGRITYSKDQFERVYLYIYLTGITIEENKIIGTLPVGYRPSYLVSTLARIGGSFGTIDISTAGAITLRNTYDSTESGGIFASASFLAA